MKINIITSDGRSWYTNRIPLYPEYELYENCFDQTDWDLVIVYENSIKKCTEFNTRHTLFISGEPPYAFVYPRGFIKQFDKVVTSNRSIKHPDCLYWQQALPIYIGRSWKNHTFTKNYSQLYNLQKPDTLKGVSLMASTLSTLPGHAKRLEMVKSVCESGIEIDIFGRGRKFVDDKIDAILPYMFHVCIENSSIEDYWTEKLADPIVCMTVPIYYGCANIEKYFDPRALIAVKDKLELEKAIRDVTLNPEKVYREKLPFLLIERDKLFKEYNIIELIKKCEFDFSKPHSVRHIQNKESFPLFRYLMKLNSILNHTIRRL